MTTTTADAVRRKVSQRMGDLRAEHDLSLRQAAARCGITHSSWLNYESGRRDLPLYVALRIQSELKCGALVTVADLG